METDTLVWKCSHGFSAIEHPNCWLEFKREVEMGTVGYLDIETIQLTADFGMLISWAIKTRDKDEVFHDCITQNDLFSKLKGTNEYIQDYRVTKSLTNCMKNYQWIITFYGTYFDIPFSRTKALFWKRFDDSIEFPIYSTVKHHDVYFDVKSKLRLHSNRLEAAANVLGITGKNHVEPQYWRRALSGDEESLKWILDHNINDVIVLEKVHKKLELFVAGRKTSI
jgi:uncharacterized protein YprB with RNaseH-like and TPR domain